ncbi:MAG: hypothetical protein COA84_13900 [Robiginitomaculum sp.]|nr:MAG: hypothetical protein COA84_13900 [Robiginitomaculum sp.]
MQLFLRIPRVAAAFRSCVFAHDQQLYGSLPYFTHPLQVAETLIDPTEDELVAALLHDVVEDTALTLEHVRLLYGDNVCDMIALLTKDATLSYEDNILRIVHSRNMGATRVKWADNLVNMKNDKSHMTPDRRDKLNARYIKSFLVLSAVLGV